MKTRRKLGIAGANRLFCECLAAVLATDDRFSVHDHGDDFAALLERLRRESRPDIVLIDLTLARDAVLDVVREIARDPGVNILLLGIEHDERETLDCIEAGGKGIVPIDGTLAMLRTSIETVLRGELAYSHDDLVLIHQRLTELSRAYHRRSRAEAYSLTARELEVLRWVERGLSNQDIAGQLRLSVFTIKNHVHHILEKLGASDRFEAARIARHQGWVDAG